MRLTDLSTMRLRISGIRLQYLTPFFAVVMLCFALPEFAARSASILRAQDPTFPGNVFEQANSNLPDETDQQRTLRLFRSGKYEDAAALAKAVDAGLGKYSADERWPLIAIRSQMATGKYSNALVSLDEALERFPNSIRLRWIGAEVCRYNNDPKRAGELLREIDRLVSSSSYRYRDVENQIVASQYLLAHHVDAKQVMTKVYDPVKKLNPENASIYAAIGQLALDKNDYGLAAENFGKAIEFQPDDPDLFYGLAQAYQPSDHEKTVAAIQQALQLNPNHVGCLLMLVEQHVSAESYDDAARILEQILEVNPHQPIAWSYRAVLAHLDNDPANEGKYRGNALGHWPGNPAVDHVIGRELSQKYRFQESVKYQRRSLMYQEDYLPAKMQLAHDLLRLGQELEGWKLADEVFDADQYSVVAHNLVTLRNNLAKFRTLEGNGFVVRMETEESFIYGVQVLELLTDAKKQLCEKYGVELETPVFVEIFPRQQDFAIRTFGLPGGSGFLGVCFGRLITMNSPAAQGANLTSWESVLWHEFCHVVTLQKTKNKMPRWLSEGISVYEEHLADSAWGELINPKYREMLLDPELTPVSKLSGAFLNPKTGLDLQFAYFESSLVVEFIVNEYGIESLVKVLDELSFGTPINDALRRHVAPPEFLDKQFAKFARQLANKFAAGADWDKPDLPAEADLDQWRKWNQDHPGNIAGLLTLSKKLIEAREYDGALKFLDEIVELDPAASPSVYVLQARAYRELGDQNKEQASLEMLTKLDADSVEPLSRLLELLATSGQWELTKKYARRLFALNPLIPSSHRYLSIAAEKTNDDAATVESLKVLARMNPLDAADIHCRLASALFREHQVSEAKRHVLMALEQAPRYRDAHRLLLQIKAMETTIDQAVEKDEK